MPMTMRPPLNASRAWRSCQRGLGGVEVVGLRVEVLDGLGHDTGAGRQDELVVAQPLAIGELDRLRRLVDPLDLAHHELDQLVQQSSLGPLQMLGALAAHGDVHEARLIGVNPGRIDDSEAHLTGLEVAPELPGEQVGGERATHAAAQDEDALHVVGLSGSSRR